MEKSTSKRSENFKGKQHVGMSPNQVRDEKGKIRAKPSEPSPTRTDLEPGIPKRLALYRWINEQSSKCDFTEEQRRTRKWVDDNPMKFADALEDMENSWARKSGQLPEAPELADDSPFAEIDEAWNRVLLWERSTNGGQQQTGAGVV